MKHLFLLLVFLSLFSCKEKRAYSDKFEAYAAQCDTSTKLQNPIYDLLVDSVHSWLSNYSKHVYPCDSSGVVTNTAFFYSASTYAEEIDNANIVLYKNNKLAFQSFAEEIISFADDTISINRGKNFKDMFNIKHPDIKIICLENIIITWNSDPNAINLKLKHILADKDYMEIEFTKEGAFWTRNNFHN